VHAEAKRRYDWRRLRRIFGVALAIISLVWAVWLLRDAGAGIWPYLAALGPAEAAIAYAFLVVSLALSFPTFFHCMAAAEIRVVGLLAFAHFHFVAQLMKNLPGRFFGVVYQVTTAEDLGTVRQWIVGNGAHMIITLWMSLTVPVIVLWSSGVLPPMWSSFALLTLSISPVVALIFMRWAKWREFRLQGAGWGVIGMIRSIALIIISRRALIAGGWLLISWVVYLASWAWLGLALPVNSAIDGLVLGALYSLAWAAGFATLVTPSGLGVREASFAFLAVSAGYDATTVAAVAVIARVALLSADVLLGLLAFSWRRND